MDVLAACLPAILAGDRRRSGRAVMAERYTVWHDGHLYWVIDSETRRAVGGLAGSFDPVVAQDLATASNAAYKAGQEQKDREWRVYTRPDTHVCASRHDVIMHADDICPLCAALAQAAAYAEAARVLRRITDDGIELLWHRGDKDERVWTADLGDIVGTGPDPIAAVRDWEQRQKWGAE